MRQRGRIVEWNDDRGFGFITPLEGGPRVFAHVSQFPRELRRPEAFDLVTYELGQDDRGRPRASDIAFMTPTATRASQQTLGGGRVGAPVWVSVGALTIAIAASASVIGARALVVAVIYLVLSTITYFAYMADKSAAQRGAFRTQESALHLLALAGGWPGALIAQRQFHHKTRKASFQTIFVSTVILNIAALILVVVTMAQAPS